MKNILTTIALAGITLQSVCAGDITGTVTFKGKRPEEAAITPLKDDAQCGKLHPTTPTTHFYEVGPNQEFADVIVSLQGPGLSGKSTGASAPAAVLDQKGCEYIPSIMAVQTGQKIQVKNSDPVLHNVHDLPATSGNDEKNVAQAPNGPPLAFSFAKQEEFLKFKCDVHGWMFAWVSVYDHPYFAVTDKTGTFKISNVPAGKYKLQAAHRKAGKLVKEIEVKEGEPLKVDFLIEAKE